jgi:CRP-like cAMP-binding protein
MGRCAARRFATPAGASQRRRNLVLCGFSDPTVLPSLSHADYRKVAPHLESIVLSFADVLTKRNALVSHVYFPTSGLIALRTPTVGRPTLAVVGSEGMVGCSVAAGLDTSEALVVVQGDGAAMRVNARRFRLLVERSASLQRQMHRYTVDLLRRAAQIAVCNGVHRTEARLARCLLETSDRAGTLDLRATQEQLAYLIGARRTSVSIVATSMRRSRLITYARGRLRINDRQGLRQLACACYGAGSSWQGRASR